MSILQIARPLPHAAGRYFNKRVLLSVSGALLPAVVLSLQVITVFSGEAYGDGSCTVLPSGAVVCKTGGGGGPATTTTTTPTTTERPGPPSAPLPPYYVVYVPCDECVSGGTDEICTARGSVGFDPNIPADWVPGDPLPDGDTLLQLEEEVSSTTGKALGLVPNSAPNVGDPCNEHTPPPPPPPSPAEAWAAAVKDLPVPQIRSNPVTSGLVQLETWFWLGNDQVGVPVTVTAAAGGGSVTATVYPVSYTWDFGPPGAVPVTSYTAGAPGSASNASAVYTYADKGTYEVTVAVTWSGSYTFDKGAPIALPPVSEEQSFPYEVREVRSVLGGSS
ncbi:MAG TPA: PKD domain-containing protein [Acidimicrobiales bacterium]|nr:PKD domain-containing protein [Acidimicrobiales bacterium]